MLVKMLCRFISLITPFECLDSEDRWRLLTSLQLLKEHLSGRIRDEHLPIDTVIQQIENIPCRRIPVLKDVVFVRRSNLMECLQSIDCVRHELPLNIQKATEYPRWLSIFDASTSGLLFVLKIKHWVMIMLVGIAIVFGILHWFGRR